MKQKLLASILIVAMLFSLVPAPVFAAGATLTEDGTLTISGTGSANGTGWNWNGSTLTVGADNTELTSINQIVFESVTTATIDVQGTVNINSGITFSAGIEEAPSLTIQGDGILNITDGNIGIDSNHASATTMQGTIAMTGGNLTVNITKGSIYARMGTLNVKGNNITVNSDSYSPALTGAAINISGGKVAATSTSGSIAGVFRGTLTVSGNADVTLAGIVKQHNLIVDGGTLTVTGTSGGRTQIAGGNVTVTNGTFLLNGSMNVSSTSTYGTLTVSGGTATIIGTVADGVTKNITGGTVTIGSGSVYVISFNANGGNGTMDPKTTTGSYTLPECTFTGPAAMPYFKGWSDTENGTTPVSSPYTVTANTTFYAIWTADNTSAPAPTIKSVGPGFVELAPGVGADADRTMQYTFGTTADSPNDSRWKNDPKISITNYTQPYYFFARYADDTNNTAVSAATGPSGPEVTVALTVGNNVTHDSTSGTLTQTASYNNRFQAVKFAAAEGCYFNADDYRNIDCGLEFTVSGDEKEILTIELGGASSNVNFTVNASKEGVTLKDLAIQTAPNKTVYTAGEDFDPTGMVVTAIYSDNTTAVVSNYTILSGDSLAESKISVTISYTEGDVTKRAAQTITVNPATVTKTLESIAVIKAPDKTVYTSGENFDSTGMVVTATYSDQSTAPVTGYTVTDGNALTTGKTTVTISYTVGGNTVTTTQAITVNKIVPTIAFASDYNPSKLYDGVAISNPTAGDLIITGAEYSDVVFIWTDDDGNPVTGTPVNSGSYILTVTIQETSDRVEASATLGDIVIAYGYDITVTNGISSAAKAAEGTTITITANAPTEGMKFKAWNTTPSALTFVNGTSTTSSIAEFTMPASAVEVKAIYEAITNDDGNEGDNDTPVTPPDGEDDDSSTPPSGDDEDDTTTPSTSSSSEFTGSFNYPITVSPNDNGSAILSDSNAVAGESVTITTKPNSGYGAVDVIVTDENGNVIPVTDLGNGQYAFTMPEGEVNVEVVYKPAITMVIDSVYINVFGKIIKNDVAPVIVGDRTMLPIRVVAEALGADVDWDAELQKVTITKGDTVIELFIGETTAYVNGNAVQLDAAPFIDNDRTYLPVRFVSEYLGAIVYWDADTRTVTVIPE